MFTSLNLFLEPVDRPVLLPRLRKDVLDGVVDIDDIESEAAGSGSGSENDDSDYW